MRKLTAAVSLLLFVTASFANEKQRTLPLGGISRDQELVTTGSSLRRLYAELEKEKTQDVDALAQVLDRLGRVGNLRSMARSERLAKADELLNRLVEALGEVVNDQHWQRLEQLMLRDFKKLGPLVFQQASVREKLNLTEQQRVDIARIVAQTRERFFAGVDAEVPGVDLTRIRDKGYEQVLETLDGGQRQTWEALLGPEAEERTATNLDFESVVKTSTTPQHWMGRGTHEVDLDEAHSGTSSGRVRAEDEFGTLTQCVAPQGFRGKRVIYKGYLKTSDVAGGWAGLWLRVDGPGPDRSFGGAPPQFDNMQNRGVTDTTDWKEYQIVLDVPEDAEQICFGCLVVGTGTVWVDDLSFHVVGPAGEGLATTALLDASSPTTTYGYQQRALEFLKKGDVQGYQKECVRALDVFGDTKNPSDANLTAWVLAMGPGRTQDVERAIKLAEQAADANKKDANAINTLGAVLYRGGRYAAAIEQLNQAMEFENGAGTVWDWVFLAMARHKTGDAERALERLESAITWLRDNRISLFDAPSFAADGASQRELKLLVDEATVVLGRK